MNKLARPPKLRRVENKPVVTCFKPMGVPNSELLEIVLAIEELEAIRLKDLENLEQAECAVKMQVSRPTFVRILNSARQKIAEALLLGKRIRIEGGTYHLATKQVNCKDCNSSFKIPVHIWEEQAVVCPDCGAAGSFTEGVNLKCKRHRKRKGQGC